MEQLMLKYMLDLEAGAEAHPLQITPTQITEAVRDWCQATQTPCPDLGELKTYLELRGNRHRYAPRWLRLCSAIARDADICRYIPLRGQPYNLAEINSKHYTDLAFQIMTRVKNNHDKVFQHVGSNAEVLAVLHRLLNPERYVLLEFTAPRHLLANMQAVERYSMAEKKFDTTADADGLTQKCFALHGLANMDESLAFKLLQRFLEDDKALFRDSLPLWLYKLVTDPRLLEIHATIRNIGKCTLEMVKKSDDPVVKERMHEAFEILKKLVEQNDGILDLPLS